MTSVSKAKSVRPQLLASRKKKTGKTSEMNDFWVYVAQVEGLSFLWSSSHPWVDQPAFRANGRKKSKDPKAVYPLVKEEDREDIEKKRVETANKRQTEKALGVKTCEAMTISDWTKELVDQNFWKNMKLGSRPDNWCEYKEESAKAAFMEFFFLSDKEYEKLFPQKGIVGKVYVTESDTDTEVTKSAYVWPLLDHELSEQANEFVIFGGQRSSFVHHEGFFWTIAFGTCAAMNLKISWFHLDTGNGAECIHLTRRKNRVLDWKKSEDEFKNDYVEWYESLASEKLSSAEEGKRRKEFLSKLPAEYSENLWHQFQKNFSVETYNDAFLTVGHIEYDVLVCCSRGVGGGADIIAAWMYIICFTTAGIKKNFLGVADVDAPDFWDEHVGVWVSLTDCSSIARFINSP